LLLPRRLLDTWATDSKGAVALHLKQKLLPVEAIDSDLGIVFPRLNNAGVIVTRSLLIGCAQQGFQPR
jgi:hypothetical protein